MHQFKSSVATGHPSEQSFPSDLMMGGTVGLDDYSDIFFLPGPSRKRFNFATKANIPLSGMMPFINSQLFPMFLKCQKLHLFILSTSFEIVV